MGQSALQGYSDFIYNLETNNEKLVWRLISLEMKVTVDKDFFETTVINLFRFVTNFFG